MGSVVALVPGLVYNRTQLTRMPNYPHVSLAYTHTHTHTHTHMNPHLLLPRAQLCGITVYVILALFVCVFVCVRVRVCVRVSVSSMLCVDYT